MPLLLKEIFANYGCLRRGEVPPSSTLRPYRDFIIWLRQRDQKSDEMFWRNYLSGFTAPTPLAIDRKSSTKNSSAYAKQEFTWPAGKTLELRQCARRSRLTMSTLIQGAWALLLARYSGEREVVFGTTVSGR